MQGIQIRSPFGRAFAYVADPSRLPQWTHAVASVDGRRAVMRTPAGDAEVDVDVMASRETGTIDWTMTFRGGQVARAWSRLVPSGEERAATPRGPRGGRAHRRDGGGQKSAPPPWHPPRPPRPRP